MDIRPIRTIDIDQANEINELRAQLDPAAKPMSFRLYEKIASQPHVHWLGLFDGESIKGFAMLVLYACSIDKRAIIEDVIVHDSLRGQGYGRKLTEALIEIATEYNVDNINLTSSPHREAANNLYLSMGFEKRNTNCYRLVL